MRILRLVAPDDFAVELHPNVTVVTGLSDDQRRRVVAAFDAAAGGRTAGLDGLLEVHGVLLDLDQRSLGLLGLEDAEVDVVVEAGDLPGAAGSVAGRQLRAAERRLEAFEVPFRQQHRTLEQAEAVAESARRAVEDRHRELEASPDVPAGPPGADAPEGEADEADVARLDELRAAIALHASFDPAPVRAALDHLRLTPAMGQLVPSPEALALADRLQEVQGRVAELEREASDRPGPGELEAVEARLEGIRGDLAEAERTSARPEVDADIAELERAHAEVVEARERLGSRFGRARAQQRLDDAVAAEETVLGRLGFRSYTDFMTGGRAGLHALTEPDDVRRLRELEREAHAELRRLETRAEQGLELAAAAEELRDLRDRAHDLVADHDVDDEGLVHALLVLRVPAGQATPVDELTDALEGVGLPVRSMDLPADELEAIAADWLAGHEESETRRAELEAELAAVQRTDTPPAPPSPPAEQPGTGGLALALQEAELAAAAAREAVRRARAGFDEARAGYEAAAEDVEALRHAVAEGGDAPVPVEEIEWYLLARLAAQRQVSFAGSVPLVLDRVLDAVEGDDLVHLLERLERMAGAVQVVHVTDVEAVASWAERAGEDRAAVVGPVAPASADRP